MQTHQKKPKKVKHKNVSFSKRYDQLNQPSWIKSIEKFRKSTLCPEPKTYSPSEITIYEHVSIQTPACFKLFQENNSDIEKKIKMFLLSNELKMKHHFFNKWYKKWNRSRIFKLHNEIQFLIEQKRKKASTSINIKEGLSESSDSDIEFNVPPILKDEFEDSDVNHDYYNRKLLTDPIFKENSSTYSESESFQGDFYLSDLKLPI